MKPTRHSLFDLYVHLIWATRGRKPVLSRSFWMTANSILKMNPYRDTFKTIIVGGYDDHAHILANHRPDICAAQVAREVKSSLSHWLRKHGNLADFSWQGGYAAYSVSPRAVRNVMRYIEDQENRHRRGNTIAEMELPE